MQTLLTDSADEAAGVIRRGGLVAFPTETVYGLGADVFNEAAIRRIFEAKGRPPDNPLIVHIAAFEQIGGIAANVSVIARRLMDEFFPGPLTIVLKKRPQVPDAVTAGLDTVGVRMPSFPLAHEMLARCGTPVAAPSANLSGRPSPTTWQAVVEDLDGRIDCILKGTPTEIGLESTVVSCTDEVPVLLRPGSVTAEMLRRVVPNIRDAAGDEERRQSPGMRHRHYAPEGNVQMVSDPPKPRRDAAFIGLSAAFDGWGYVRSCQNVEQYAREVFEFFRECDRRGIGTIYCQTVEPRGIGAALMDRLRRAAEK